MSDIVEWLREELEFAEGKYLACYNAKCEVDRKLTEASAFLDELADRCDLPPTSITQIAFDCRAMAKKLRVRGET